MDYISKIFMQGIFITQLKVLCNNKLREFVQCKLGVLYRVQFSASAWSGLQLGVGIDYPGVRPHLGFQGIILYP
jgi:hypothetical protein